MSEREPAEELIATILREEADRGGPGIPPPLEELAHRAAVRRRCPFPFD